MASVPPTDDSTTLSNFARERLALPSKLHDFQWEGVSFLFRSRGALLADEMGLGKTVQTSVALALLFELPSDVDRALVVAPASLTLNWMSELQVWAPHVAARRLQGNAADRAALYALPIPVLVASYEQIRNDGLDRIPHGTFDLVVLDEAQRIKDPSSATSLACRVLPRRRSWALSATPLENRLEDIATILRFVAPSLAADVPRAFVSAHLDNYMLRRRKRDVRQQLPPVIIQDIDLELTPPQRTQYEALWERRHSYVHADKPSETAAILGLITRLKVICNRDSATGASSKLEALVTVIEPAGESARIIIFSQFVKTLEWLSEHLPFPHDMLVGSMSLLERETALKRFRFGPTPRLLLASLRAAGVGLNLGEATHVVMFDRWWNPAVENQAIYRAHRFTRSEPLHVVRFLVRDSIEERIESLLNEKALLFDEVVDDASTPPRGIGRADLLRILEIANTPKPANLED